MGIHIGLIAAKTSVTTFREAFPRVWAKHEVVATADSFPDAEAMLAWKEANEQFVSAADCSKDNPGKEVYLFWQDGPWAVMMDESYVLASEEEKLKNLSSELGTVVSFVIETAGGCSFFWCYQNGTLRRSISNNDMEVATEGGPLPEEAEIDTTRYYVDEAEALMKALGLAPFEAMPTSEGCQGICVIDRTDYERVKHENAASQQMKTDIAAVRPSKNKKPWWRFW